MNVKPEPINPGQESVWDFPRPAIAEPTDLHCRIAHRGKVLAETRNAIRTLETSHPPTYYIPPQDVNLSLLKINSQRSLCEWKGQAHYFDAIIDGQLLGDIAWSYAAPTPAFSAIENHIAFYAAPFDQCSVDGELVTPQPGGFYGGWITSHVAGPFKGIAGSRFW